MAYWCCQPSLNVMEIVSGKLSLQTSIMTRVGASERAVQ